MRRFILFLALFLVVTCAAETLRAQKVVASFKVIRDKLQGRNLDLFDGLEGKVLDYINNYDWSRSEDPTPLNLDFQMFLDRVVEDAGSKRVVATLYVTNGKELQFLDNGCTFVLSKGTLFYHDETRIEPLLSIFDFYVNVMLGDEMDALGKYLGTPFFQKAKSIASQAKSLVAYNAKGWDDRLSRADLFLDPRYQDYRIMKDQYYEALFRFENGEVQTARKTLRTVVSTMETLLNDVITKNHTERFLQVHYLEICRVFEASADKSLFDRLIQLDPRNADTYRKYRDGNL